MANEPKSIDEQRLQLEKSVHVWQKEHSWKGPLLTGVLVTLIGGAFSIYKDIFIPDRNNAEAAALAIEEAESERELLRSKLAEDELAQILKITLEEPRERQDELFCGFIDRDAFNTQEARLKLDSLTNNKKTCFKLAEERAIQQQIEEDKLRCETQAVYVTGSCRAYDKSGFHGTPNASCGITLNAGVDEDGTDRFFDQDKVEVVSEFYRKRKGNSAVNAITAKPKKDKGYNTVFSGRISCSNSKGTGRTCEAKATVRAKSFPLSCRDIMRRG